MQVVVTVQPDPLVSVDEAKVALGESGSDRNALIEGLIMAAQSEMDGPKGWVGISVAEQSIEVTASSFDDPVIRLPGGPIVGDIDVVYLDSSGDDQTLEASGYVVLSDGTLSLPSGATWPALYEQDNAVLISYDVGIDDQGDPRIQQMKTAIIMHVRMTLDMVEPEKVRRAIESLVRSMWVPVL